MSSRLNESEKLSGNDSTRAKDDYEVASPAVASPAPGSPPAPPNGGAKAWLQVLGSWAMVFNTWGTIITFGDYQAYYERGTLFTESSANISWIGSIQSLMVFLIGAVIGPLYDRGYLKLLLVVGSFGIVFGHMMLSLCTEYWQVVLAQGFVVGIGGGCIFIPALAVVQPYFGSRLGLAFGIVATGSSLGGIIYPIVFINLIDKVGFAWTTRAIGFIALGTLVVPLAVSEMRVKRPRSAQGSRLLCFCRRAVYALHPWLLPRLRWIIRLFLLRCLLRPGQRLDDRHAGPLPPSDSELGLRDRQSASELAG